MLKRTVLSLLLLVLIPAALLAQGSGASLTGRVTDEGGGALPGVTVTVTNPATGFTRSTVTATDGSYHFPSIPAGTYNVTADLSGFATVNTRNVELNVASERELNVTLKQAAVKEQITVTAQAPLVETTPAIGTVVSQREMQNLPLNGRQFANLGSLAPGTTLSVNSDPTKPGQLTIALNGGSGRNVNFLVDGGDNTDDTIGGALQNYNIEAVQEFNIQTQQFKDDLLTAKATGDITPKQFLQVRYGYQKNSDKYGASPVVLPSALGTITNNFHSTLVGHTWQVSTDKLNEFLFQDTHFKNSIS